MTPIPLLYPPATSPVLSNSSLELARTSGSTPGVYRFVLPKRQASSSDEDWSYGESTEMPIPSNTDDYADHMRENSDSYIIRIPFVPRDKYIPKEQLWPYIPEFVDGALNLSLYRCQKKKTLGASNLRRACGLTCRCLYKLVCILLFLLAQYQAHLMAEPPS